MGRGIKNHTIDDLIRTFVIEDLTTNCWNWTGAKHLQGYNLVRFKGKMHRAERLFKIETDSLTLQHSDRVTNRCGNMDCVNPDHYEVMPKGTYEFPKGIKKSRFTQKQADDMRAEYLAIPKYHGRRRDFLEKYDIDQGLFDRIIKGKYVSNRKDA